MTSTGVFACWQPQYAERGIATFPVKDKRPCIRGWQKIGLKGSSELASKYANADAFGFQCGARSRLTIIDIDSNDERMVGEAEGLFGSSPVLWRTGNGNYAMPFRHNGEARRIRPVPGLPIDILGDGYAVAPPSMGARTRYEFLKGGLPDLDHVPIARFKGDTKPALKRPDRQSESRNNKLFHFALEQAGNVDDTETLLDVVRTRNEEGFEVPLNDAEVVRLTASAWGYQQQGRNLVGRGRAVVMPHGMIDGLLQEHPDAFMLLLRLRRHHWGRDFMVLNAMADSMPGGGWRRKRLAAARAELEKLGLIKIVKPAGWRAPALYRLKRERDGQK